MDNVDNFVDRWVKLDILGRKLVKKGDEFQDIGVNLQKYNVDKMETTWGKPQNSLRKKYKIVDNVDNLFWIPIEPEKASKKKRYPISVALERGLNASV